MIELTDVSKQFGDMDAVLRVNLSVRPGEIFGLLGPDGAGKTTLIRLMLGLLTPSAGQILLLSESKIERVKSRVGYVPQKFSLYRDLTVMENIRLIGALYGLNGREIARRAEEILTFTGLWPFRDRLSDHLSGGMKQKLALAAGLLHKPSLIFLDEPTTGVDPVARREFWQLLYELNRGGATVVAATPYMDEAELCGRVAFLSGGRVVGCKTPETFVDAYPYRLLELAADRKHLSAELADCDLVSVHAFGATYHLATRDAEAAKTQVIQKLRSIGATVRSLREIRPTLEDVFIALAEKGGIDP